MIPEISLETPRPGLTEVEGARFIDARNVEDGGSLGSEMSIFWDDEEVFNR